MNTLSRKITVKNRFGLHMRPAAEVSKMASEFDAIVSFFKDGSVAHAHSVVEMLTLGALCGDELNVTAIGNDAEEALEAIATLFESCCDDRSGNDDIDSCAA